MRNVTQQGRKDRSVRGAESYGEGKVPEDSIQRELLFIKLKNKAIRCLGIHVWDKALRKVIF